MTDRLLGPWPLLHREADVVSVVTAAANPELAGVLIVGDPGQGKTAIAREAAARLGRSAYLVYVRGSVAMAETPYGALSVLMMELDLPSDAIPLVLLQSLQNSLLQAAGGRPVVVVVDNVEHLDRSSVMALSYLAEVGAARLLVASESSSTPTARFFGLWAKGLLARVDVMPFDFDTVRRFLHDLLEAPVSWAAAVDLWRASRGNPRYLQVAVRSGIQSGMLALEHDTWVLVQDRKARARAQRNDAVVGLFQTLTFAQRIALELIAVTGALPLDALLAFAPSGMVDEDTVDELERSSLCRIGDEAPHLVTIGNDVIGDRVRADLAANPPSALLQVLQELDADDVLPSCARLRVAEWLLEAGLPLPDDYLLRTARLANDEGDSAVALDALRSLATDDGDSVREYARACVSERRIRDGYDAVAKVLADGGADRAGLLEQQVRLAVRSRDHRADVGDLLVRLQNAAAPETDGGSQGGATPSVAARIVASEAAAHEGTFLKVLSIEAALPPVIIGQDVAGDSAGRAANLVLAHGMAGEYDAARSVAARAQGPGISPGHPPGRHALQESLFVAHAQAGALQEALALTAGPALLSGLWDDASTAECLEGCLLAQAGRGRAALARLLPSIAQLRIRDKRGLLPLAEAATAYASALVGKPMRPQSPAHAGLAEKEHAASWLDAAAVRLFDVLTDSLLRNGYAAARLFGVMADDQRDCGHHGVELLLRMHAVRLGNHAQAPALLALARSADAPLSAACELLASGALDQDPRVLLAAAEAGLELGHLDLAGSAARMSMTLHGAEDDPLDHIRAEQILRGTNVPRENVRERRVLTSRERAFLRMAAGGASNKEIAGTYHLSVRTVEGHVLRAMNKLGLSNRKQLSTVFGR